MIIFFVMSPSLLMAQAAKDPVSSVKKMIGFIRYKKNDSAIKYIDTETFSKNLLKSEYDKLDSSQKSKFEITIHNYIKAKSFPIALKYFDKIDITYEKPIIKGKDAELPASLLYKGSEKIQFSWILVEKNGSFLVTDFLTDKKLASDINSKQLLPILQKKGFDELIRQIEKASK
jgi:ABC-type transporter MlaC component